MEIIQTNEIVHNHIEVKYRQSKFIHRALANFVDFLIFSLLGISLFVLSRNIVSNTDKYKIASEKYKNAQLESGLYVENENKKIVDLVTYFENGSSATGTKRKNMAEKGINTLFDYLKNHLDLETYSKLNNEKTAYLTNSDLYPDIDQNLSYYKEPYFIIINEEITLNPVYSDYPGIDALVYKDVYKNYIDDYALKYFQSYNSDYLPNLNIVNNMLLFICMPISVLVSGFLVWFVPPLFFRRGRKTLGKALYHIGAVNNNLLNISFGLWILRFLIFFFLELILSVFTFGIPFIVSVSLMAFSKKKQGFPDYMLGIIEIDTSNNKIYFDKEEIARDETIVVKQPIDFKMEKIED